MPQASILIVDDDATIRSVLVELFQDDGYEVQTAENGQDALDLLRRVAFDVLLTDLAMPVMDGQQLVRILHDEGIILPLVVMTASQGSSEAALLMGAAALISKPLDVDALLQAVADIVRGPPEPRG